MIAASQNRRAGRAPPATFRGTRNDDQDSRRGSTRPAPGAFDVELHFNATLFGQGMEIPAMQRGNLEAAMISPQDIAEQLPEYSIFTAGYLIQDRDHLLVLGGEIRAGIILWQQPVASDAEARRIVTEASQLRGMAFRATEPGDARRLRYRAAALEVRLVDSFWRETAADLLRLPQAA